MLASGINVLSLELADTTKSSRAVSGSPIVNGRAGVDASSLIVCASIAVIVGGSLDVLTVRVNVVDTAGALWSLTKIVMLTIPLCPAAGVTVTVRSEPVPSKVIPPVGTIVVLLEVSETMRSAAGVSGSPIVKGSGSVGVFSAVV